MNSNELDYSCLAAGTVAGEMRQRIGMRLDAWGLEEVAGDVLLVAGELIVNACQATPEREIRIRFAREARGLLIGVWDSSDERPAARPVVELTVDDIVPDPLALEPGHVAGMGGRGLVIVQALASECGVTATRPSGKWVWARCAIGRGRC
ncbi:ATP-binding protein [Actinomadura madurae]|uniref:ATP-binding protein n=1 Tax=Actinomadura madurae TaxID=1993 RepID=UPI0020D1F6C8|nr:ATP-binding protein [Actinomadura madurae]MCP9950160.1 ATP-binding protein [Actinomadura madurae]MCP9966924.1 ATP-binding protein [Actinomadura madurae]MCP9979405.1 ATP-binding protein [Actinomadura madurae]MCQ0009075.1 ATP-binding protein [Actinomadura madurae]MCQ0015610.1 ATP-binding protein [Actinomadura madurae]